MICRGCDFILDTGFLGDGILDEEHQLRPGAGGVDPGAFNLADAVILGNIDDESQSFETSDSGFHMQAHLQARLYVSGRSQALMSPDAVPALSSNSIEGVRLTPFERHVLAFIDGKKPVEVIRRAAGLDEAEVKTALATLADKGVVKVVGRALADFDPGTETAPRLAQKRHRVRGSMVGAVALVGDEADRAIEEAFRTQVALNPIKPGLVAAAAPDGGGDVFVQTPQRTTGSNTPAVVRDSELPSDFDQFVGLKGTDEIEKKKLIAEGSAGTVRPSSAKAPVKRPGTGRKLAFPKQVPPGGEDSQDGIDASAEASALSKRAQVSEASDGFDDFGQPSDLSTAVVQQASESSAPESLPGGRPKSGVFADISDSDAAGAIPALGSLADSRVQARPKLAPAVPPPRAQRAPPPIASEQLDSPSVEIERAAASGEVWDDNPHPSTGVKETLSASLSDLLSDKSGADEETKNIPPERAALIAAGQRRRAEDDSSFEEPTAAGQPPPPLPLPRIQQGPGARAPAAAKDAKAAPAPEQTNGRAHRGRGSAMASMPDEADLGREIDEHSGLHDVEKHPPPRRNGGAVDEIFDENSDSIRSTHSEVRPKLSTGSDPELVQSIEVHSVRSESVEETAPPSQEPNLSDAASDPDSESEDGSVEMVDSGLVIRPAAKPAMQPRAAMQAKGAPAKAGPGKAKKAPLASMEGSGSSDMPARPGGKKAPPPPPPDPSFEDELSADAPSEDRSAESARANEDSQDTVNIDPEERKRRGLGGPDGDDGGVAAGRAGNVAAIPSGFSQVVAQADVPSRSRPKITDENRRKARNLFDEAMKDAADGRLAQARMNAKLATIYDPDNVKYRDQLQAWERPPTVARPQHETAPSSQSQNSQSSRLSDESQAEIKALYDEAQGFEDAGDVDQALEILERGATRFPGAAAFHNRIGVILALKKRDFEGAVAAIQRAIDIDPENLHYKSNLGKIVAKLRGRGADAE